MPEYLAPGVFVEEVSYRAKSIEGVSTTTTGFIGPTRSGPIDTEPDVLTSLVEFERTYGDGQQLVFDGGDDVRHNYMWHAARAFFENGGKRLYVQRVFRAGADPGVAAADLPAAAAALFTIESRFPGAAGNRTVRFRFDLGPNLLIDPGTATTKPLKLGRLREHDVVIVRSKSNDAKPDYKAYAATGSGDDVVLKSGSDTLKGGTLKLGDDDDPKSDEIRRVTVSVIIEPTDDSGVTQAWTDLALDGRQGATDALFARFPARPTDAAARRTVPIAVAIKPGKESSLEKGLDVLETLLTLGTLKPENLEAASMPEARSFTVDLVDGNDGLRPEAGEYEGKRADADDKSGLKAFEDVEDISIVAAPGSTAGFAANADSAMGIIGLLISHAERMRYRIAVLDSGEDLDTAGVRQMRARMDSKHAALYYPWVRVMDPITREPITLPPSGFIAGIYARNDVQRAVYKAPANEVVALALGFERTINTAQQEVLNPEGINCLRFFEGRGNRVWGARTISSDPEWKYVNLRRYFAYLERSIDVGTQWAVFEPNGPQLWANVRRTISDFLFNEFVMGAYLGDKPETSYFVKCDRSTMTQNDIDNGRLVCLVGVAVVKPAEFVIFRVGQWTADAKR